MSDMFTRAAPMLYAISDNFICKLVKNLMHATKIHINASVEYRYENQKEKKTEQWIHQNKNWLNGRVWVCMWCIYHGCIQLWNKDLTKLTNKHTINSAFWSYILCMHIFFRPSNVVWWMSQASKRLSLHEGKLVFDLRGAYEMNEHENAK